MQVAEIEAKIAKGDFEVAEKDSQRLAALVLRGIDFYDTFDQNRLKLIVTWGYASFALYTLLYTMMTYGSTARTRKVTPVPSLKLDIAIAGLAAGIVGLFIMEKTPWYCLYVSFPLFFTRCLLQSWIRRTGNVRGLQHSREVAKFVAIAGASIAALFYMAVSSLHALRPNDSPCP